MASAITILVGLFPIVLALLEGWQKGQPKRAAKELEGDYDRDIRTVAGAVADKDAAALTQAFEAERLAGVLSGRVDPRPPGARGVPGPAAAGDHGGPGDRP